MNELDELRRESYENSRIYKERLKLFHDKNNVRKIFEHDQKVLLYSSRLHMFPGKWIAPFIVEVVYPYGTVEIENPKNGKTFKVNGQRLKPFLENFDRLEHSEELVVSRPDSRPDPIGGSEPVSGTRDSGLGLFFFF